MTKRIYRFGAKGTDGDKTQKDLLGGKGAALAGMCEEGIAVPPGFTVTTTEHKKYLAGKGRLDLIMKSIAASRMPQLKSYFGYTPLVSVRSGAPISMPGMMDTILNVGLSRTNLDEWSERIGRWSALDSYRRLIEMFGSTVHGIPMADFNAERESALADAGVESLYDLSEEGLDKLCTLYEGHYELEVGEPFPDNRYTQIAQSIEAVWGSWMTERAVQYRKNNDLPEDMGTACTVQAMVFGNIGETSCSGVYFTRNPSTGENKPVGEFLPNAQGEDVVSGTRTPTSFDEMPGWNEGIANELIAIGKKLEVIYGDVQDIEFTVQDGELWLLQTRSAKRTAQAAFRIATDLLSEGLVTADQLKSRLTRSQYKVLRKRQIATSFKAEPTFCGLGAGGGVVTGIAVFDPTKCDKGTIFVAKETNPEDYASMVAADGFLTQNGGITSHAAVVARSIDKPAVVGAADMLVFGDSHAVVGKVKIKPGTELTMDGNTGRVWVDIPVPTDDPDPEVIGSAQALASHGVEVATRYTPLVDKALRIGDRETRIMVDMAHVEADLEASKGVAKAVHKWLVGDKNRLAFMNCLGLEDWARSCGSTEHSSDQVLAEVTGFGTSRYREIAYGNKVNALKAIPKELRGRVVAVGCEAFYQAEVDGFIVARQAGYVSDLLEGARYVTFKSTFWKDTKMTKPHLDKLLSTLNKGGIDITVLPGSMYGDEIVFTWLS